MEITLKHLLCFIGNVVNTNHKQNITQQPCTMQELDNVNHSDSVKRIMRKKGIVSKQFLSAGYFSAAKRKKVNRRHFSSNEIFYIYSLLNLI